MIIPLNDRVLIKQDVREQKSGFVMPDESREGFKDATGVVLGIGEGVQMGQTMDTTDGRWIPILSINDRVYFNRYSGERVQFEGHEYLLLKITDLLAKYAS